MPATPANYIKVAKVAPPTQSSKLALHESCNNNNNNYCFHCGSCCTLQCQQAWTVSDVFST